jgi:hypothetical protein
MRTPPDAIAVASDEVAEQLDHAFEFAGNWTMAHGEIPHRV